MGFNSVFTPAASLQNSGFLPGQSQYPSPFSHQIGGIASHVGCESFNINCTHQQLYSGQSGGMLNNSTNNFTLKWLAGTRVTRGYGCGGDIQNPPLDAADDLIIVYKGIRCYRDKHTGQLHCTNTPQNVHFHLRIAYVRAQYPHFTGRCLLAPMEFAPRFRLEHFNRLTSEFGWTP